MSEKSLENLVTQKISSTPFIVHTTNLSLQGEIHDIASKVLFQR